MDHNVVWDRQSLEANGIDLTSDFSNLILDKFSDEKNLHDIFSKTVNKIRELLNIDRCNIAVQLNQNELFKIYYENNINESLNSLVNHDFTIFKTASNLIINNVQDTSLLTQEQKNFCNDFNIKSFALFPIYKNANVIGNFGVAQTTARIWTQEELFILEETANFLSYAIKLSIISVSFQDEVQKEHILRIVTERIRTTLDIEELKANIVREVGQFFKADRCFIKILSEDQNKFSNTKNHAEYLSENEKKGSLDFVFDDEISKIMHKELSSHHIFICPDSSNINSDNEKEKIIGRYLKDNLNVLSNYGFPIFAGETFIGVLALHYTQKKVLLTQDNVNALKMVTSQAGVALQQARLHEKIKEQTCREALLREIITNIANSLNIKQIKETIVVDVCKFFNASRCFIMEYDKKNDSVDPDKVVEYFDKEKCNSIFAIDVNAPSSKYWFKYETIDKDMFCVANMRTYLKEKGLKGSYIEDYLNTHKIKSVISNVLYQNEERTVIFVIQWDKTFKSFSKEDVDFFNIIKTNASIALTKAYLYNMLETQIKKEDFLRSDESILINRQLAKKIGLSCAITYSVLTNIFYYMKDEATLLENGFFTISINDIIKQTCLSLINQRESIKKLKDINLILYKDNPDGLLDIKIIENVDLTKDFLATATNLQENVIKEKIDKNLYDIKDLGKIYSEYYSQECVNAVVYFLKKVKLVNCSNNSVSRLYFSVICRTLFDFMNQYNLHDEKIKHVINEWFSPQEVIKNPEAIIDFGLSYKVLAGRLKKILLYRLQEAELVAIDFSSKIDFQSNIDFKKNKENNNLRLIKPEDKNI